MDMEEKFAFEEYFGLCDRDAFVNVAERVVGRERMAALLRRCSGMSAEMVNDKVVDEAVRILNHPLVRLAMRIAR